MLLPRVGLFLGTQSLKILANDPSGLLGANNIIYVTVLGRYDRIGEPLVVLSFAGSNVSISTVNNLYGTLQN